MKKNENRIEISNAWRLGNENTQFVLNFDQNTDMEKVVEAMILAIPEERDPYFDYKDVWAQDLEDCKNKKAIDMMSALSCDDFQECIPAMVKGLAEAMPNVSFKGYGYYDDLRCYYIDSFDFEYKNGNLVIEREFKDEENGYFCPDCGCIVAMCGEEIEETIFCEDCEKELRKEELVYVAPEKSKEEYSMVNGKLERNK